MSGYRQSNYDPRAGGDYGPPLRPFNWVQWSGVGFIAVGVTVLLATIAGSFGLFDRSAATDMLPLGTTFAALGTVLINSRRAPGTLSAETKRRRTIILGVAVALSAVTAALVYLLQGAN